MAADSPHRPRRPGGRVRLRDVLRIDVPKLHAAITSRGVDASPAARVVLRLMEERRAPYKMRVLHCPPLPLLWGFAPGDGSAASIVHRAWAREVWRERGFVGRLGLLAFYLLWPPIVFGSLVWCTWRAGIAVRRRTGKGIHRQAIEQLWLAARHAILPPWYYIFELFDDERRARAGHYLRRDETKGGIYRLLRSPGAQRRLYDKVRFAERCRERGIAIPRQVEAREGRVLAGERSGPVLPRADLFAKPSRGRGGRGMEEWRFDGEGWSRDGARVVSEAELLEHLAAISRTEDFVVQARLKNHPELADLCCGVLSTVRLLTCRDENGHHEVTHAILRMARGPGTRVDNFHAGGLAARVDIRTGELGAATDLGLHRDSRWYESHPHSGAPIQGRKLPFWSETLDLARRAHAAFPAWAVIGWDIALAEAGPTVIEGNSGPGLDAIQRTHRAPLGESRLGTLLAFHLTHLPEGEPGAPRARLPEAEREAERLPGK